MRCLKPVITCLLLGLIGVAGCGGNVVVDGQGAGEGGAGGVSSSGSLSGSVGNVSSSVGNVSSSAGQVNSAAAGPSVTVTSGNPVTTSSGGTGVVCGMQACYPVPLPIGGIVLPACCPDSNPNKCGLDLTTIASFIMFPPGCTEVERPGNLDPSCPDKLLNVMGMMINLPGCCSGGMCGVFTDFSGLAPGLNFGCADASDVMQSCGP